MKRLLAAIVVTLGLATGAHAVCDSRTTTCMDALEVSGAVVVGGAITTTGAFKPYSRTIAQLNALAPSSAGTFIFCSNCVRSALCVSTGTATGAWAITVSSDTSPAYTAVHCQ